MAETSILASRRDILLCALAAVAVGPAAATPASMASAMEAFARGAPVRPGRVALTVPALVENGNAVPLTIEIDSPMTEGDHVKRIAVFNERNPQPNVATFELGPRAGRARISTRIRLGDSQRIAAIAEMSDGSLWSGTADLIVTLPACIEQ
ncbi:MAG: SoxY-related AACIE arm protein [Bosea sp.]|jgi:sulfur-oxidizing protein SoxY|nr:SoxY-related AACIE arm protein [Bosea sp. (in: a-proteobacteria)]